MIVYIALIIVAGVFISLTSLSEEGKLPYGYNKKDTWENKYKPHWLPLRTSIFVFTTDFFHLSQWMYKTMIELLISVALFSGWWTLVGFVCIKALFSGVAQSTRWIVTKKIDG